MNIKEKNGFFMIPGYYQASLPPRISTVDYGSLIRYDMPDNNMMGVPRHNNYYTPMYRSNYVPPTPKCDAPCRNDGPCASSGAGQFRYCKKR